MPTEFDQKATPDIAEADRINHRVIGGESTFLQAVMQNAVLMQHCDLASRCRMIEGAVRFVVRSRQ